MSNLANFFTILSKSGDLVKTLNDGLALTADIQAGHPVNLAPLEADLFTDLNDFHVKLPAWANSADDVVTFVEAGINAVKAKHPAP